MWISGMGVPFLSKPMVRLNHFLTTGCYQKDTFGFNGQSSYKISFMLLNYLYN